MAVLREAWSPAVAETLVVELAVALHGCGTPAHRLEAVMEGVCAALGVTAQVLATPTMLLVTIDGQTQAFRVTPGEVLLGRMVKVDEVAMWVARGVLEPAEALDVLRRTMTEPPPYDLGQVVAAFGVVSAGAVVFLGGGWREMVVGGGLGLAVGGGILWLGRRAETARLMVLAVSFGVALLAGWCAAMWGVDRLALTLAALIVVLPGFSLTTAISELSAGHLAAGAARLSGVVVSSLLLAVGAGAGWAMAPPPLASTTISFPVFAEPLALLVSGLGLVVLFQARLQDAGVVVLAAGIAFFSARLGMDWLGPLGGAFAAALLVTLVSNVQARMRDCPASLALVPGILLLVPGTVGFQGMDALLAARTVDGVQGGSMALLIAASLVAGILTANAVLPSRRAL